VSKGGSAQHGKHYRTVRMDEKRAVMERVAEKLREAKAKSEKAERATGLEPATACLGSRYSTN
jgi:hypothetical protein